MKTRDDRPSSALSRRLNLPALLRWLLMVFVLAAPGYAYAADPNPNGECTALNSSGNIQLKLPASVTIRPGMLDIPAIPPVTIKYKCSVPGKNNNYTVALVSLSDVNNLVNSLKSIGLTLKMTITDESGGSEAIWTFPGSNGVVPPEYVAIGASYMGNDGTGDRTMTINATLSRNQTQNIPGFYAIPALSAFRLKPYYNNGSGPLLISPTIRLQYVPTCFVQTSLNTNNINFGPVLTTDVDSNLDRQIPFTVTASVNKNCNGGKFGNLQTGYTPDLKDAPTYYLDLPLKVSFVLNNGGEASSDRKSILLYKESTSDKNGLQLEIKAPDGNPVTFNEASLPVNKFGNFQGGEGGGTWNIINSYQAVLSSTGEQVKTGKYSAQVTVKVDYY
ncbi:TPA: fimbrial protein [Salmonella enterica subsp. enterica serovar Wedding]|nr:fimbrial protein [Salmonella enterica subsp. enterica serovar Wedding]